MPRNYTRKNYGRKPSRFTRKLKSSSSTIQWAKKRKDARSQAGQIIKTNKTVNRMNNRMKALTSHVKQGLLYNLQDRIGDNTVNYPSYQVYTLCPAQVAETGTGQDFPLWEPCFSGVGDDAPNVDQCTQLKIGNIHCKLKIVADTEPSPVNITVMVFRVKEDACPNVFEDGLEDLSTLNTTTTKNIISGLSQSLTGSEASQMGVVTMNPEFFNILWQKRLTIGSEVWDTTGTDITNQRDVCKDYSFSIPCNYNFGQAGRGTASSLTGLAGTARPRRTYFAVFSDNNSLDSQYPSFSLNAWCYAHGKL